MLFETQQYTTSMVMGQVHPVSVYWTPDYTKISTAGETMDMDRFRQAIQGLFGDAWTALLEITGGNKFAIHNLCYKDDLRNDTRGYSFLDHGPFTAKPYALLCYLVDKSTWNIADVDSDGKLWWNIPALREILSKMAALNNILALLCFIVPSMATRLTQFIDDKLRNDQRLRNLHMIVQEMISFTRYHKMTNLTGQDVAVPAFYPEALRDLMLEYTTGGLRECEELFSRVVDGPEAASYYHR